MSGATALIVVLLIALILGVPIGWSLALSSLVAMAIEDLPLAILVQKMFTSMDSFPMLAIPCFLVAGDVMAKGSISKRMCDLADSFFGTMQGGLAVVAVFY